MSRLALYFFGPPRLELDGTPVHISRRKATALLAYLAVTIQPHSRDALATLFWPENDQSSARANLRRMLSSLNRSLGAGWIQADRETVCLNIKNDPSGEMTFWLDVSEFQKKLKICESHNHSENETCPDCLPALEEAVALYNDDFMAGFSLKDCPAFDEWQFFQAEEFRSQFSNVLVQLSSYYEFREDYKPSIQHTRQWLSLDPLHEPAHQKLMRLYEAAGQRAAALRQYQTCREILSEELGVEPSQETQDHYQQIKARTRISLPDPSPKSNLPIQTTPFIGRENELLEIRAKLKNPNCHLLTLLGPGGSGKTRLAIQAADGLQDDFKHGVYFVNLAPLEDVDKIPSTIAAAIGFSFSVGGTPEEQLLDYLGNKQMLLVLDNFEHLISGSKFVNQIIIFTSRVKILTTSRTSLAVTGEHIYEVMGMVYPETLQTDIETSSRFSAIKLFESVARQRQPAFKLNTDNIPDVIRVCSLVEGMPLGIVLAASWMRILNPSEIAEEISQDLAFLDTKLKDLPQRQRSLKSVFNHSWRLLSDSERGILGALSIFQGGFTREAALRVADASIGNLMGLIDKSFLQRDSNDRFEIHELLRQYAVEKLAQNPIIETEIRGVHSDYYCQALVGWERDLQGPLQVTTEREMSLELDNIRAAWTWALDRNRKEILFNALNGLCIFYFVPGRRLEGAEVCQYIVDWLESMQISDESKLVSLENEEPDQIETLKLYVRALAWAGFFNGFLGEQEAQHKFIQKCLSTLERSELVDLDTRFEEAIAYACLPWCMSNEKKDENTKVQFKEKAINLFKSKNEHWWVGLNLALLGHLTTSIEVKLKHFEESLSVRRKLGDLRGVADSLRNLVNVSIMKRRFEKAETLIYEAIDLYRKLSDRHAVLSMFVSLGDQWVFQGRFHEAQSLYLEIMERYGDLEFIRWPVLGSYVAAGKPDQYLGLYNAARIQVQHALEVLSEANDYWAAYQTANAFEILGRINLAERDFTKAESWFQKGLAIFQTYEVVKHQIGMKLAGLGYAERGLNRITQAKGNFYSALYAAIEMESCFALAHTLPGIALLFTDQGEVERAVEFYALASTQGIVANSKWFADIAGDEIAAAAENLSPEVVEAAKARGRARDLWDTAEELLEELEELGWGIVG